MQSLDSMIMDIEAGPTKTPKDTWNKTEDFLRIKFLAIAGGHGPELILPRSLAEKLITVVSDALEAMDRTADHGPSCACDSCATRP